jgi:hypothetical protein
MRILFGAIPDSLIKIDNMKTKNSSKPITKVVRSTKMMPSQPRSAIPVKPKTTIPASYRKEGDIRTTGKILKNVITKKPIMTDLILKKKKTGKEMLGSAMKKLNISQRDRYARSMSSATKKGGSNGVGVGY